MNIKKVLNVAKPLTSSSEVPDELADKTVKFIGLVSEKDDGLEAFVNLVITVKNGIIVDLERLPTAYDNAGAINEATAWIDTYYWNHGSRADE